MIMRFSRFKMLNFLALALASLYASPSHGQFSITAPVNSEYAADTLVDNVATVKAGANGVWLCAWNLQSSFSDLPYGNDLASGSNQNENVYVSRSTDNGRTWSAMTSVKAVLDDHADDLYPELATDGQGRWMMVWQSRDSLGNTIGYDSDILSSFSSDDGATWSAPVPVNTTAMSDPGGSSGAVGGSACDDVYPHVYTNGMGVWMVGWQTFDNRTGSWEMKAHVAVSKDNGAHWTSPVTLMSRSGMYSLQYPVLGVDRTGRWLAVWSARKTASTGNADLFYSISQDEGKTWGAPAALFASQLNDDGDDHTPCLETDGAGRWTLIWNSTSTKNGTLGSDNDIFFAQSPDDWATWSAPGIVNRDAATDGSAQDQWPFMTYDGKGNWIATWSSTKLGGDWDCMFAVLGAGKSEWTAPLPLNSWAASDSAADVDPFVASDRKGRWMTAWSTPYDIDGANAKKDADICVALCPATPPVDPALAVTSSSLSYLVGSGFEVDVLRQGSPTVRNFGVENRGLSDLVINPAAFTGAHAVDFSIASPGLPITVRPFTSQTVQVRFAPVETSAVLNMSANLALYTNDPLQPSYNILLIGDAVPVSLSRFSAE